eukprot:m51a1_g8644 hypothetical protein (392) ;mRNA; r:8654-10706
MPVCRNCFGSGWVDHLGCRTCRGTGRIACPACYGVGLLLACNICGSEGFLECNTCRGCPSGYRTPREVDGVFLLVASNATALQPRSPSSASRGSAPSAPPSSRDASESSENDGKPRPLRRRRRSPARAGKGDDAYGDDVVDERPQRRRRRRSGAARVDLGGLEDVSFRKGSGSGHDSHDSDMRSPASSSPPRSSAGMVGEYRPAAGTGAAHSRGRPSIIAQALANLPAPVPAPQAHRPEPHEQAPEPQPPQQPAAERAEDAAGQARPAGQPAPEQREHTSAAPARDGDRKAFKKEVTTVIIERLSVYWKENRIAGKDDFKHLARRLVKKVLERQDAKPAGHRYHLKESTRSKLKKLADSAMPAGGAVYKAPPEALAKDAEKKRRAATEKKK